jgi:hypothetical protein
MSGMDARRPSQRRRTATVTALLMGFACSAIVKESAALAQGLSRNRLLR